LYGYVNINNRNIYVSADLKDEATCTYNSAALKGHKSVLPVFTQNCKTRG